MKKCILFLAMLLALCFALTGCDSGSSGGGDDPVPPPAPSTYTVSFDMKGHGTQIDPITGVESGAKITKPADPTATGFNFVRWCKDVDCITAWDFDSDTVTEDITLYAEWTDKPVYTISFVANGGSGSMTPVSVIDGDSAAAPENEFILPKIPTGAVNEGADILFKEWNTQANGKGAAYAAGASIPAASITTDITLYAQWAKPSFSVAEDKKVYFSKGNLYWDGSKYQFEAKQYDYRHYPGITDDIAVINGEITTTPAGTVGSFFWIKDTEEVIKPYGKIYGPAPSPDNAATDTFFMAKYKEKWGTLTKDEWLYVLNTRSGNRYAKAKVDGFDGLIIFPDGYSGTTSDTGIAEVNRIDVHFPSDSILETVWTTMESNGVVFLPVTGFRNNQPSVGNANAAGRYWSSTPCGANSAYGLNFTTNGILGDADAGREAGRLLRLVWYEN